jgi:hypothetical protein
MVHGSVEFLVYLLDFWDHPPCYVVAPKNLASVLFFPNASYFYPLCLTLGWKFAFWGILW